MSTYNISNIESVVNLAKLSYNDVAKIIKVKQYDTAKAKVEGSSEFKISEGKRLASYFNVSLDLLFYGDRTELLKEVGDFLFCYNVQ